MKNLVVVLTILISGFAAAQGKFEQAMGQSMKLWGEGKNTEASDMFARIASAEPSSWLPNYYVAAVNCFGAFTENDKDKKAIMLAKAQDAIDFEISKNPIKILFLENLSLANILSSSINKNVLAKCNEKL